MNDNKQPDMPVVRNPYVVPNLARAIAFLTLAATDYETAGQEQHSAAADHIINQLAILSRTTKK